MEPAQEESSPVNKLNRSSMSGVPGVPEIPMDRILYYAEHPELEPPLTIKNMVNLIRMMKENEENSAPDTDTDDSSSDVFYSSDDEEKEDDVLFKKTDQQMVYTTTRGIRVGNAFFTNSYLARPNYVFIRGKDLIIHAEYSNEIYVPLPENFELKNVLQIFEDWTDIY